MQSVDAGQPELELTWRSDLLNGELEMGVLRRAEFPKGLRSRTAGRMNYALFAPARLATLMDDARPGTMLPLAVLEGQNHVEQLLEGLSVSLPGPWERRLVCTSLPQAAEAVRLGVAAAVLPVAISTQWPPGIARMVPLAPRDSAHVDLALVWNPAASKTWPEFDACRSWFETMVTALLVA